MPIKNPAERRAYQREWKKKDYARLRAEGKCVSCRRRKAAKGSCRCRDCRDWHAGWMRDKRAYERGE